MKRLVESGRVGRDAANAEWKRRTDADAAEQRRLEAEAVVRERQSRVGRLRAKASIPLRHASYDEWDALRGPDAYMRCVAAVRRFVETGDSVLALIGTRGTGKTQAGVVAICETINGGESARYTTAVEVLADLKGRYSADGAADTDWLAEWGSPHLLVIDEIADRLDTDHARVMLAALVDRRYRELKPTILIGNVTPETFAECVGSSIADRAKEEGGLVRFDRWPSFRGQTPAATLPAAQTPRQGAVQALQQTIGAPAPPNHAPAQPAQSVAPGPGLAATAAAVIATMDAARAARLRPAGGNGDPKAAEFDRQRRQAEAELAELRKRRAAAEGGQA